MREEESIDVQKKKNKNKRKDEKRRGEKRGMIREVWLNRCTAILIGIRESDKEKG